MKDADPTFSFGENWTSFLAKADAEAFAGARADLTGWLGERWLEGKRVLDLGSGSGLHSFCLQALGASQVVSIDLDPKSVSATTSLWEQAGRPENWRVLQGSALDRVFMESLGAFDLVYSWGVLHHTGALWTAMDNAVSAIARHGLLWTTLYTKGPHYPQHLALKQRYNRASPSAKRWIVRQEVLRRMWWLLRGRRNPFTWNRRTDRGMDAYHDLVDWLGGLPYEVASADEVVRWGRRHGLILERISPVGEGGCSGYIFSRA